MTYETARCPICRYGVCPRSHNASIIEFSKCVRRHQVTKLFGFPSQPFRFKKGVTASVSPCCISTMVPYWSKVRTFISRLKTSSMPVSSNNVKDRVCSRMFPVRIGSKGDILVVVIYVRFTPESGHCRERLACPLCAKSRHSDRFWISLLAGKGAQVRGASPVKLPRRQFLHLAAGAASLTAVSRIAWGQSYPTRPVRIIVATAPGGLPDIRRSRLLFQCLAQISCALTQFAEQPRVLDGNDGLGGEGPEKRYLLIRKWINFGTSNLECSDRHALTQQWNTSNRPVSEPFCQGASFGEVLGLGLDVNYMNGFPLEKEAPCNSSARARETKAL